MKRLDEADMAKLDEANSAMDESVDPDVRLRRVDRFRRMVRRARAAPAHHPREYRMKETDDAAIEATIYFECVADVAGFSDPSEPARLRFDPADPTFVETTFVDARDHSNDQVPTWLIDREILAAGGGVDNGDLRAVRADGWLTLTLSSESGTATLRVRFDVLDAFLDDTYRLVPRGEEITEMDLDLFIADVLGSTT